MIRLQKLIAEAGLASRREAEIWITEGRVKVNGQVVTKLGTKVDPRQDRVSVNNKPIRSLERKVYYLFNKPKNVMVTRKDPEDRPIIYDYLKKIPERVVPAGRLDFDSEGLILLTNDGELVNQITHPRSKVTKTYLVKVKDVPTEKQIEKLKNGIMLEEGKASLVSIVMDKKLESNCLLKIVLAEGKRRQIRRMLEAVGLTVLRLQRIAIGPFRLGNLKPGNLQKIRKPKTENRNKSE